LAIYHLHAQIIGRTGGRSAVAAAAYRATERLEDRTTGEVFDYSRKSRALSSGVLAPDFAPPWCVSRGELWQRVEEKETRKNSQLARELDLALPAELSVSDCEKLVKDFCRSAFVSRGLVCDFALHRPDRKGDERNRHAHIMITTRKVTADGWGEKDRDANSRLFLAGIRELWAEQVNAGLKKAGYDHTHFIDHRTLEAQGSDRPAQTHQGVKAAQMARRGVQPDRRRYPPAPAPVQKVDLTRYDEAISEAQRTCALLMCPPEQWAETKKAYALFVEERKKKAYVEAVKAGLPAIRTFLAKEREHLEAQDKAAPARPEIAPRPGAVKALFFSWRDSTGTVHDKWQGYETAQKRLQKTWDETAEKTQREIARHNALGAAVTRTQQEKTAESWRDLGAIFEAHPKVSADFFRRQADARLEADPDFCTTRRIMSAVKDAKDAEAQAFYRSRHARQDRSEGYER
jgi:hypothetical protein